MYKLVAFDIDGTLIPHSKNEFPNEIKQMMKELKNKGLITALVTGRDFVSIANLYQTENIDYFIGANGSFIYDIKNKKYIFNSFIDFEEFKKYNKEVLQENLQGIKTVVLSDDKNAYIQIVKERKEPWFWEEFSHKFKNLDSAEKEIDKGFFHLITVETRTNSDIVNISRRYFELNNSELQVQSYWPNGMFVANRGINKASTLKKLTEYLGFTIKEVIAFGDGENDTEMIKEVGLGVAMDNATEQLKKIADDTTISVEKFGTLFYLKKIGII